MEGNGHASGGWMLTRMNGGTGMSEKDVVARTAEPVTIGGILRDLRRLGVEAGDALLVHSSLSSIGRVCGGPQAVVDALLRAVGDEGTLVMPVARFRSGGDPHAGHGADCRTLSHISRDGAFRPPAGVVLRERAAGGGDHGRTPATPQFGEDSPLGRLYGMGAKVLLLGAGYHARTSYHLAGEAVDFAERWMAENRPYTQ